VQDIQRRLARLETDVDTVMREGSPGVIDMRRRLAQLEQELREADRASVLWRSESTDRLARIETKLNLAFVVMGSVMGTTLGALAADLVGILRLR
jgi:hypothetical protein